MNNKQILKHEKFLFYISDSNSNNFPMIEFVNQLAKNKIFAYNYYLKSSANRKFAFWFDGTISEFLGRLSEVEIMKEVKDFEITWHSKGGKFLNVNLSDNYLKR